MLSELRAGISEMAESDTSTDPLLSRKTGPAISSGVPQPHPVLGADLPWESLSGLLT